MNIIETKNLTREFSMAGTTIYALRSATFSVPKGQFLAITGKSGSGKSTLLYQLSLLDKSTSGEVFYGETRHKASELSDYDRTHFRLNKFGYVFQDYALLPTLTALENVALPLIMQGKSKIEAYREAIVALKRIGLEDKNNNLPSQLSGGQQQRVSIARAIAHKPDIIFADEPTANLDSETAKKVLETFIELHKEGQTIIMVTHERDYADKADRIIVLSDGEIESDMMQFDNHRNTEKNKALR